MKKPPLIGVSACLLGHSVRYDGLHKYHIIAAEYLGSIFQLLPICPEIKAGLGVPRPKIELTLINKQMKLLGTDEPQMDVTQAIKNQARIFLNTHRISGMVLKDKSPSCGINNAKVFNVQGEPQGLGNGLFAEMLITLQPDLPLIQANVLQNQAHLANFIERVWVFQPAQFPSNAGHHSLHLLNPN